MKVFCFVFFIAAMGQVQTAANAQTTASKDLEGRAIRFWKRVIASGAFENCTDQKKRIKVGSACATSKGFVWQRVEVGMDQGWKDIITGTIWFDQRIKNIDQNYAKNFCVEQGHHLPTGWPEDQNGKSGFPDIDSDFVSAEKHGIREVFPGMKYNWNWSASVLPGDSDIAYAFNTRSGRVGYGFRDSDGLFFVRCVARR